MQHGNPVSKDIDPERPLTEQGVDDVKRMALFFKKNEIRVDCFFHSGKTRARHTAEIMCSNLKPDGKPVKREGLAPLDDVKVIASQVMNTDEDLLITGHLPHLGKLASFLVYGNESLPVVEFKQGAVACIKRENDNWVISWMIIPEMI